jgi:hypothetical protein
MVSVRKRKRLFISGIMLILGAVGVFVAFVSGAPVLVGMRWDIPWLLEHWFTFPLICLWCFVLGCWCLCGGAMTYFRTRPRTAFLSFAAAILLLPLAALGHWQLNGARKFAGTVTVRYLYEADGVRWTALAKSSLTPSVSLWRGEGALEVGRPDLWADTECWDPYEFRGAATKGRFLLVGRRNEAGALIDLNVPSVVKYWQLPDLESLREEFGADVNLVPMGD